MQSIYLTQSLNLGEVHIWSVDLDDPTHDAELNFLSKDEQQRANRFATNSLQLHFKRCRSQLRRLLAHYTGKTASELVFNYGPYGKPELSQDNPALYFNVSHSKNQALIAVSLHNVGVDIEKIKRSRSDIEALTQWVCHPDENALLSHAAEAEQIEMFYQLWTHKEAYCKAIGCGLQQPLPELCLNLLSASQVAQFKYKADDREAFLYPLSRYMGYAASICVSAPHIEIKFYN